MHDPTRFPDPESFNPNRWLNEDGTLKPNEPMPLDPCRVVFGYGRRICPGKICPESPERTMPHSLVIALGFARSGLQGRMMRQCAMQKLVSPEVKNGLDNAPKSPAEPVSWNGRTPRKQNDPGTPPA